MNEWQEMAELQKLTNKNGLFLHALNEQIEVQFKDGRQFTADLHSKVSFRQDDMIKMVTLGFSMTRSCADIVSIQTKKHSPAPVQENVKKAQIVFGD